MTYKCTYIIVSRYDTNNLRYSDPIPIRIRIHSRCNAVITGHISSFKQNVCILRIRIRRHVLKVSGSSSISLIRIRNPSNHRTMPSLKDTTQHRCIYSDNRPEDYRSPDLTPKLKVIRIQLHFYCGSGFATTITIGQCLHQRHTSILTFIQDL